jgi:hypothetical protein
MIALPRAHPNRSAVTFKRDVIHSPVCRMAVCGRHQHRHLVDEQRNDGLAARSVPARVTFCGAMV